MYCEKTLRKRAEKIGYAIEKGYQHYMAFDGAVFRDCNGKPRTGYNVIHLETNCLVYPCYNGAFDHLFDIEDLESFLKTEYQKLGLTF